MCPPVDLLPTCVALLPDLCEGPIAMFTLDDDCVSVVFPPSAADRPEMTKPLEKLRFPNSRLSVDEDEDTWGTNTTERPCVRSTGKHWDDTSELEAQTERQICSCTNNYGRQPAVSNNNCLSIRCNHML